jgi:hypothetical protein
MTIMVDKKFFDELPFQQSILLHFSGMPQAAEREGWKSGKTFREW